MDYIMRKKVWFWVLILLVIINVVALTTMIYQRHNPVTGYSGPLPSEDMDFRGMNYFLRHELNLTDEQFELLRQQRRESIQASGRIMRSLHDKRNEMLEEIMKEDPNEKQLKKLSNEIGELHAELKLKTFNHFLEIKRMCTPEQEVRLNQFLLEIKERNPLPGRRNPGYRHRQGNNRRFNRNF